MLNAARFRAKEAGVPFDLTVEDIVIPPTCPVLGIPLVSAIGGGKKGPRANSPTLDRLNPDLGYVRGNVAVVSFRANRAKNDLSLAEIEALAAFYARVLPPPKHRKLRSCSEPCATS